MMEDPEDGDALSHTTANRFQLTAHMRKNLAGSFALDLFEPPHVGKGGHTVLLWGGRRGFDLRQLRRTKPAFFPPFAI